jgi:hypothetical protein
MFGNRTLQERNDGKSDIALGSHCGTEWAVLHRKTQSAGIDQLLAGNAKSGMRQLLNNPFRTL